MPESPRSVFCKGTKRGKEEEILQEPSRHLKTSCSADFVHEISIAGPSEVGKIKPLAPRVWEVRARAWAESRGKLKKAQTRSKWC